MSNMIIVRPDNINFNNEVKQTSRVFYADTPSDLCNKIIEFYGLEKYAAHNLLEIWSGRFGMSNRKRIDEMNTFPPNCDEAWLRLSFRGQM